MVTSENRSCRRILVIDDEQSIHGDFRRILSPQYEDPSISDLDKVLFGTEQKERVQSLEYAIDAVFQGHEGVELALKAVENRQPYSVAFVDQRMPPGWDGLKTIMQLWIVDPRIEVVFCTAYSDHTWEEIVKQLGSTDQFLILKKPFSSVEVRQLAMALTTKWMLKRRSENARRKLARKVRQKTAELEQRNRQLLQSQKLQAIGELASGVAHDFYNLLAVIQGCTAKLGSPSLPEKDAAEVVATLGQAVSQGRGVVEAMLTFAQQVPASKTPLDLADVVQSMRPLLGHLLPASVQLAVQADGKPHWIHANRIQIQQVIMNLAINARDAMTDGGVLTISTGAADPHLRQLCAHKYERDLPCTFLCVKDTGAGISPEVRPRVFEPFFTTKSRGQGTGLGLAIVHGIVEDHRGMILVESEPEQGASFTVLFPQVEAGTAVSPVPPVEPVPHGGQELLLLVQDHRHVRELTGSALQSFGYRVLPAENDVTALDLCRRHRGEIRLCVYDLELPGRSGLENRKQWKSTAGDVPVLFVTGNPDVVLDGLPAGREALLRKPFSMSDLGRHVHAMLVGSREPVT